MRAPFDLVALCAAAMVLHAGAPARADDTTPSPTSPALQNEPLPATSAAAPGAHIARVRIETWRKLLLITTELVLSMDAAQLRQNVLVHAAYGGPALPLAFDAHVVERLPRSLPQGKPVKLTHEPSYQCPPEALVVLGRRQMAGQLVQLPLPLLTDKLARSGSVLVTLRELHELPARLADQRREVLVRLGAVAGRPMEVAAVEVASDEPVDRVELSLCNIRGERLPEVSGPLVPRAGEDLCVRFGSEIKTASQPQPAQEADPPKRAAHELGAH